MIEIHSAQELVDTLANAGDRLVIVDFYFPGCGGCKALHPKVCIMYVILIVFCFFFYLFWIIICLLIFLKWQICQLAESNQSAIFLKVNYEEHKSMCHSLHIHVLPFFRFYRGAEGRVCSFSCTNATVSNCTMLIYFLNKFYSKAKYSLRRSINSRMH